MLDKKELDLVWKTMDGEHGLLKHTYEVGRLKLLPETVPRVRYTSICPMNAKCTFWSDQTSSSENIRLFIFFNRKY